MPGGPRRGRWPALPVLLLCAGCATQLPQGDQWGVRRTAGRAPAVVSLSEVNPGQPAATRPLQPAVLRAAMRGTDAVTVRIDDAFAPAWLPFAGRVEPELQRALDWLERIDASNARGLRLDVTLVGRDAYRREQRRHPATDTLRVDLLVPTAPEPESRSASVATALAIALHETVHALRGNDTNRAADEYRASLVESCYLLDVARAGDVIELGGGESFRPRRGAGVAPDPVERTSVELTAVEGAAAERASAERAAVNRAAVARATVQQDPAEPEPAPDIGDADPTASGPGDFTARHSREAAARVLADLRRAAGTARIGPADIAALRRARAFCHQRLRRPPRDN